MNTFVAFEYVTAGDGASIYSVVIRSEENETSTATEFDQFLNRYEHDLQYQHSLSEVLAQIERIKDYGIKEYQLRSENHARALPSRHHSLVSKGFVPAADGTLRLYCVLLPDNVLILCGGGAKSGRTVAESAAVQTSFRLAQRIAKFLNERLREEPPNLSYEAIEQILETSNFYL